MKKIITVTLFLAALCLLAACGSSKDNKPAEATTESIEDAAVEIIPVELNASDYLELGDYKGLVVKVEKRAVTDADVEEEIDNYLEGYAEYKEVTDRDTVQKGDFVNVDYTCTIDGKANDEYSDTDVDLKADNGEMDEYLGSGLGDDFKLEDKVIGSKVGSTVTVEFTFPKDYDDDAVAGKKCKMDVKINNISKEVIPELNEEFVKEYTDSKSVEDYKKEVRSSLEQQAEDESSDLANEQLWQQIIDNSKQKKEFTKEMIEQEMENLKIENQEVAEFYFGMDVEDYIKETTNMTLEEYAKYALKGQCLQDLLVEAEKITATDEELQEEMKNLAKESGIEDMEELKKVYSEDDIRANLIAKKLYEKLMSYTKVETVDSAAQPVEEKTQPAEKTTQGAEKTTQGAEKTTQGAD